MNEEKARDLDEMLVTHRHSDADLYAIGPNYRGRAANRAA
jgi:hypothetical protein